MRGAKQCKAKMQDRLVDTNEVMILQQASFTPGRLGCFHGTDNVQSIQL